MCNCNERRQSNWVQSIQRFATPKVAQKVMKHVLADKEEGSYVYLALGALPFVATTCVVSRTTRWWRCRLG